MRVTVFVIGVLLALAGANGLHAPALTPDTVAVAHQTRGATDMTNCQHPRLTAVRGRCDVCRESDAIHCVACGQRVQVSPFVARALSRTLPAKDLTA